MQQIADIMNISKVSVSKALNRKEGISEKLRSEILATAESLGYEQKTRSGSVAGVRFAYLISKFFFLEKQPFYTNINYYLNKIVQDGKNELIILVLETADIKALAMPELLLDGDIQGIFVAGELPHAYIRALRRYQIPVVLIDYESPESCFPCVVSNNFCIGYDATRYLIENGHTEIGFAGNLRETENTVDRYFGYKKALFMAGLPFHEGFNMISMVAEAGFFFMNGPMPEKLPSAFVCHCDMAAYYLLEKLGQIGYRVPYDKSVISIDNTALCLATSPPLTTINIDKEAFASTAYQLMLDSLRGRQDVPQKTYLNHSLIVRESVGRQEQAGGIDDDISR